MSPFVNPVRCCPECGSKEYVFRGRRTIPAEEGKAAAAQTEYLCRDCGHEGRRRGKRQSQEREAQMKPGAISAIISAIGVLFMLAGVFEVIPWNYALFLGIACFTVTGVIPAVVGKSDKNKVRADNASFRLEGVSAATASPP
jgi:hypothetical protein